MLMWYEKTFFRTSIFPLQVVREFYSTRMQAKEDIEMAFEFGEEKYISLAVPRSGMILQSGWKIIPRYNPMVSCNGYLLCWCVYIEVSKDAITHYLLVACTLNRLGRQMLTILALVRWSQNVSCFFDGCTEADLMSVLSMTLSLLEQRIAHTSHSTSLTLVSNLICYACMNTFAVSIYLHY